MSDKDPSQKRMQRNRRLRRTFRELANNRIWAPCNASKQPLDLLGHGLRWNSEQAFTLDDALAVSADGVGLFSGSHDIVVFDLDVCRDSKTAELDKWAANFVDALAEHVYFESSRSGTGVRGIAFCNSTRIVTLHGTHKIHVKDGFDEPVVTRFGKTPQLEIYIKRHFAVITGEGIGKPNRPGKIQPIMLFRAFDALQLAPRAVSAAKTGTLQEYGGTREPSSKRVELKYDHFVSNSQDRSDAEMSLMIWCLSKGFELGKLQKILESIPGSKFDERANKPNSYFFPTALKAWRFLEDARPEKADRKREPNSGDHKTVIVVSPEEHVVTEAVLVSLAERAIYSRGAQLVQVVENLIVPLSKPSIRTLVTKYCELVSEKSNETLHPPIWLVDSIFGRGYFADKFSTLKGLLKSPSLRPDGTVFQSKGYDEKTEYIYAPEKDFPEIAGSPTRRDARRAVDRLCQIVVDFPFLRNSDRSAWLAMLLTMVARPFVDGCTPLFGVTANTRGTGKSLLVDVATMIAYGHEAPRQTFSTNDEETRKSITASLQAGRDCVLYDNLTVPICGASLDAVLTSRTWNDRILGCSKMTGDLPVLTVFCATGNNLKFGSDIARRILPIRLESEHESPELRSDFEHLELLNWVEKDRPTLVVSAIRILRAYHLAGCPKQPGNAFGSFQDWSDKIRGALVWAGGVDPLETREYIRGNDESSELLALLIDGLHRIDGAITCHEIGDRLRNFGRHNCPESLKEASDIICGHKFNARTVGRQLASFEGRIIGGKKIVGRKSHGNVKHWRVVDG